MKLLVLNGPNLNLLGIRKPEIYGKRTLAEVMSELEAYLIGKGAEAEFFQSNHEGELIDRIHASIGNTDGILFNPGAFTHYSYALRDAIESADIPCVEVHISDIHNRESFRATSVIEPVCLAQVSALGERSYFVGADILLSRFGG